jgi:hypothetical protein
MRRFGIMATLAVLSLVPLFAMRASADERLLKLNSGAPLPICDKTVTGKYVICFIRESVCLAHGGHVDYDSRDTSGSPHCMGSDLLGATKQ